MKGAVAALAVALLAVLLLTFPYIDLAVDIALAGRQIDTPIADLAGAALIGLVGLTLLGAGGRPPATPPETRTGLRPPGLVGYTLLVAAGLLALAFVPDRGASAWFLLRKPVFFYVGYGVALAWVVARTPVGVIRGLLRATLVVTAIVSLATSLGRIAAGNTLWFQAIEGLTNNHKTLAVAMAPLLPLLLSVRRGRVDLGIAAFALLSVALSLSRTAWIASAVGLAFLVAWQGRVFAARRGAVAGVVIVGMLVAIYGPVLTRSHAQMDAARSRHSLDKRAWEMAGMYPLLGMGGGANVRYEMQTFPHYRVNGVDAHGVVQKVVSEYGAVGLLGYLGFVGAMAVRLRRDAPVGAPRPDGLVPPHLGLGLWATFLALHVNLLLSTETFSQTHWVPLGLVWGLAHRRTAPPRSP